MTLNKTEIPLEKGETIGSAIEATQQELSTAEAEATIIDKQTETLDQLLEQRRAKEGHHKDISQDLEQER